ncbi:MAG: hypothetical protein JWM11_7131 [Planctomycetaceae bacterium]|nr:hypothetical protein [Planctomycetaceae bacterium]
MDWTEWKTLHALRQTPQIFERVRQTIAETRGGDLQVQSRLRKEFPHELVCAALSLHELRIKAVAKFPGRASEMWLDRIGLEQSTSEIVARHKASRFEGLVWDYCSGIGSDAAALAQAGCEVVSVDSDAASCLRATWNARILTPEREPFFLCARAEDLVDRGGLLHVDPDRRVSHQTRAVRLEDYVPGLDQMQRWSREFAGGAIKLSPAANFGGKFPDAEIELISVSGECKEATVWFGTIASKKPWRATTLPSGESLSGDPLEAVAEIRPLGRFLFDPDPAIVRAGLVDLLADRLGLARLDSAEEYLTGDIPVDSAFVRAFEVQAQLSNNPKDLKAYLRDSRIGQLEIKCRHIPVEVDRLRKQLPLPGDQPGVLIFARVEGRARAIIANRQPAYSGDTTHGQE